MLWFRLASRGTAYLQEPLWEPLSRACLGAGGYRSEHAVTNRHSMGSAANAFVADLMASRSWASERLETLKSISQHTPPSEKWRRGGGKEPADRKAEPDCKEQLVFGCRLVPSCGVTRIATEPWAEPLSPVPWDGGNVMGVWHLSAG